MTNTLWENPIQTERKYIRYNLSEDPIYKVKINTPLLTCPQSNTFLYLYEQFYKFKVLYFHFSIMYVTDPSRHLFLWFSNSLKSHPSTQDTFLSFFPTYTLAKWGASDSKTSTTWDDQCLMLKKYLIWSCSNKNEFLLPNASMEI